MPYEIKPVQLGYEDASEGVLVFRDNVLLAVLSKLGAGHEDNAGLWNLECSFGIEGLCHRNFPDLQAAYDYFDEALAQRN